MMTSDPIEVAAVMRRHAAAHPEIAEVVDEGAAQLLALCGPDSGSLPREHTASSLSARFEEEDVYREIDAWLAAFGEEWRSAAI